MQRLHFATADMGRVRVAATLGPLAEAVFALHLLGRANSGPLSAWRRHVLAGLGDRMIQVGRVVRSCSLPDLLALLWRPATRDDAALAGTELTRAQVLGAIQNVHDTAVSPHWPRLLYHLERARHSLSWLATTGGLDLLLRSLQPGIKWESQVLQVRSAASADIHLGGRGLLLAPSLFMGNRAVVVDAGTEDGGLVLVFGVPIASTELYRTPETGRGALNALVGRTRAAVLRELTVSRTTSELAARLGISPAGASQHATVLRDTGLIASHRNGNTVRHSVTALGTALLTGDLVHRVA